MDPNTANNQLADETTITSPSLLTATKSVVGQFVEGGTTRYLIELSNSGSSAQLDNPSDELVDELPAELTLVDAAATAGSVSVNTAQNLVTWNGRVAAGEVVEIEIEARIRRGTAEQTVSNQGIALFDADGDGTNESSANTDDPEVDGLEDATLFQVLATVEIPTLSELSLVSPLVAVGSRCRSQAQSLRSADEL